MQTQESDALLVGRCLKGDQSALRELYERHMPPVYNFLSRLAPTGTDVEDLAQEAFIKAWTNLKRYDQSRSFKTWFFTIAKNTLFDELKKKRPTAFSGLDDEGDKADLDVPDDKPLPSEVVLRAESDGRVGELLKKLKPAQATVVVLHAIEGMTFAQVGEVVGEPMETVKTRYRRALVLLERALLDYDT